MKKVRRIGLLLVLMLCIAVGAAAQAPTQDRAGNALALPETVETVISLAPSFTQVIVDLGRAEMLVAIDTYSAGSVAELPEGLPAFDMMAPDMEQILALDPDVVLVSGMSLVEGTDPFAQLTEAGIAIAYVPSSDSIEGIIEDVRFIGQVIGDEAGAQALTDDMSARIDALRVQTDDPTPVYFEVGSTPALYSFGSGTFLNEMIEIVGGVNIFADQTSWISVSEETVVEADPAVIFTNESWNPDAVSAILTRAGWEGVRAVQDGEVYLIDSNASSQPNHRIVSALEAMADAMKK